jgi:prepilin-type N-terminal cleavage/methylation domain-containing protein
MKTKTKGFTLVEAIVTAVILAILSAVAIPMYSGFINDQRQTTVDNLAETAAAAANAYVRRTGDSTSTTNIISNMNLYYDHSKYTVTVPGDSGQRSVKITDLKKTSIKASRKF